MWRRLAQAGLTLCLALSLCFTAWTGLQIARNPLLRPLADRSADQIVAVTDRLMAREATPERLAALLAQRLAENPRNWVAIEALDAIVAERGLILPPALIAARAAAWEEDTGYLALAAGCAACAVDPAACSLSNVFLCQVPIALTPIGDIAGVSRGAVAYLGNEDVDEIDLGLSFVGLAATALVVASGGSSATIKIGAGTAKLARRMGLLSPRLVALGTDAFKHGIDWAALPAARSTDDLARLVRMDAFAPVIAVVHDVGRMREATGLTQTLALLRYVDDGADARRLANAATALGPKTLGRIEVLGKARFLRATLHWSDLAWQALASILALGATIAGLVGNAAQGIALRGLRRAARARPARREPPLDNPRR